METLIHPNVENIKTMLQSKLNELDNMKDPIIDIGIDIHIFEMKKVGKGWKTLGYKWSCDGIIDPYKTEKEGILPQHTTLSKIKSSFKREFDLKFVIDGNFFAPSKLYQVIIECKNKERYQTIIQTLKLNNGLNFECFLNYEYIDQIPLDTIKKLLEY